MRKLPVLATLNRAFFMAIGHLGPAFRFSWAWLVILTIVMLVHGRTTVDRLEQSEPMPSVATELAIALIVIIVATLAASSIAVAWHRCVLLNEDNGAAYNLRADRTVWHYAGNMFAVVFGFMLLLAIPFGFLSAFNDYAVLVVIPAAVFLLPVLYRLLIKLPGVAVDNAGFSFADAWSLSRGNYWQLLGVGLTWTVLAWVVDVILLKLLAVMVLAGALGALLAAIANAAVQWIAVIFGISLMTVLYGFFAEGREL